MEAEEPPEGAQVSAWLEAARSHLKEVEGEEGAPQRFDDVIRCLQSLCPQLPLSYSFSSVSQLLSLQRSPCVSLLGWDTERFQQWSREGAEQTKVCPAPAVLSRARLLLLGRIEDSRTKAGPEHDGNLYVRDSSGSIPCEVQHLDLNLLGCLLLFPCWSFIPSQQGGGYLELLSPPIPIFTQLVKQEVSEQPQATAMNPERAFQLLGKMSHPRGFRVSVSGHLSSITSLISIRGKTFFFFILQDAKKSVPVIVQVPSKLCWYHHLCVGDTYEVTSLSVSSLRGSVRKIFAVTASSHLGAHPPVSPSCSSSPVRGTSEDLTSSSDNLVEISQKLSLQDPVSERDLKESKILTYQGEVTRVVDAQAGLYELDSAVLLCTAYTQLRNSGRGMREGAHIEVCDAHLQQSPSPLFSTIVLSCCLRSRVRVSDFSRLSSPCSTYSTSGNVFLHLLFRYRLRLPEYLWVCDIITKLQEKLSPQLVRQLCLIRHIGSSSQTVAERLLYSSLSSMPDGRPERDLQEEMAADPHDCPLQKYTPFPPPWSLPPLSHFLSLACQPRYLRTEESSRSLHWSYYCVQSGDLSPPHVLLGVLHVSPSGVLQLKDQSSSLVCLILPRPPIAWIGGVLEVRQYQLVTETLQLKDRKEEKPCSRTYAVFLAQDVTVLHLPQSCLSCSIQRSDSSRPSKVPRLEKWPQRSLLVESMEGRLAKPGHGKGLQFQVKCSWLDSQESTEGKQNGAPSTGLNEDDGKASTKVLLLFSSPSTQWFPFLLPNEQYLIIARGETDLGVFRSMSETSQYAPRTPHYLKVPRNWTLEDIKGSESSWHAGSLSIEEAMTSSSSSTLVSVTGVVFSRSMYDAQNARTRPPDRFLPPGVSIKVVLTQRGCLSSASVYLDLSMGPYPLGLLQGATVLMQGLERKMSRHGRVYFRCVPTTYLCILSPPAESKISLPPPPLVLFSQISGSPAPRRTLCTVTCVLTITLFWECSACGAIFTQGSCERLPSCTSQSGVFRAKASVKAEDGSREVKLFLQDEAVFTLLGVSSKLWGALQRQVLSRGKLFVKNWGRGELPCEAQYEDRLINHVMYLISRPAVSRPLLLTFIASGHQSSGPAEPVRFTRGDLDYLTRLPPHPDLFCQQLQEVEPRTLCHMIRDRNQSHTG